MPCLGASRITPLVQAHTDRAHWSGVADGIVAMLSGMGRN